MFKYALVTCLTHGETVWDIGHLYNMIYGGWDEVPGLDGKTCNFLIAEAGVFTEMLTPFQLKQIIEEEKKL